MINRILTALDKNSKREAFALVANLIDWNKAFPRQCPQLGVKSFIKNGVRPSLIPILISFFQNRKMSVKWHWCISETKDLPGGGPQGATLGFIEYLSQSNDSANIVPVEDRYKFVDDLTALEIGKLILVGITSFNLRDQVPNDIPIHNNFIPSEKLESQEYLDEINKWTIKQKMLINQKKTRTMILTSLTITNSPQD